MAAESKNLKPSATLKKLIDRTSKVDPASFVPADQVDRFLRGEVTLKDLNGISGPEMLEMAVLGYEMYKQGKYNEARVIFQGLASLDPREPYFATALGSVYLAEEKLEDAERCLDVALGLNPDDLGAHVNRGEVYLRRGKLVEAAEDFRRVLELDPQQKDPLTARARVLAMAAFEAIKEAKAELEKKKAP